MAGTAVVAMGCGGEPGLIDVAAVASSVRGLTEAGWNAVVVAPPAPPGAGADVAGRITLALGQSRAGRRAVPVVTHTLVDPADPALSDPPATAFPEPLAVLESEAIAALLGSGFPVVVARQVPVVPNGSPRGFGGVPQNARGFGGVPQSDYRAVVTALDEAAFAQRLAGDLGAAVLVFVAGDDGPLLADGPPVGELDLAGAERHLAGRGGSGVSPEEIARFAAELRAAVRFLRSGGDLVAIATPAFLPIALDGPVPHTSSNGDAGTRLFRVRRTLPRLRSESPVLAAGWC